MTIAIKEEKPMERGRRWGLLAGAGLGLVVVVLLLGMSGAATAERDGEIEAAATQSTGSGVLLLPAAGVSSVQAVTGHGVWAQTRVRAKQGYNSDYIFGLSKGLADSTLVPALKVPVFILTVPLDLVLLPFALIGGFFG